MKKFFKSALFASIFIFIFSTSAFASVINNKPITNNTINTIYKETTAKNIALKFISNLHENKKIGKEIKLYNFQDKENSVCFILKNGGYIIVSLEDYSIPEFSITSTNRYFTNTNKKYIYNGPGEYYQKNNNTVISLINNKLVTNQVSIVDKLSLVSKSNVNTKKQLGINNISESSVTYNSNFLPHLVPSYTYNPNGVCGSTAAAMFVEYWNDYIDGRWVPTELQSGDGTLLIKALIPYCQIDGSAALDPTHTSLGSGADNLANGIHDYLNSKGVQQSMYWENFNINRVEDCINNKIPAMITLANHPVYGNHVVVASGYIILNNTLNGTINFIQVSDGWGGQGTYVASTYCDKVVW
ncbi:hypothetical protein [Clostridium felsineum]|uniref:Uncharacterized protein n=1 Tax=Clostridium felsineum TaxID=36839 RepID=A0A1S8LCY6_9CLOT|nr:hypothetical protein [Clostridium felsineum]URZ08949.1 hypothetical protein CLROS_043530 [Clostridium felsineum]URZ09577.1 hypothetical protein CROST_002580 [Clostridium felsineum]